MSTSKSNRPASSRSRAATRPRTASSAKSRSANATCSDAASTRAPRCTYGQRTRGIELSFTEPYFLDYRLAFGIDFFAKQIDSSSSYVYKQETIGGGLRFGIPLREDFGLQLRYSIYRQKIDLDQILRNCNNVNPNFGSIPSSRLSDGAPIDARDDSAAGIPVCPVALPTAKLRRVKQQVEAGPALVSLVGYGLVYNTLDNNKSPTRGLLAELRRISPASAAT